MTPRMLALLAMATAAIMQLGSLALLLTAGRHPADRSAPRSYRDMVTMLDGQWFLRIATSGYPTHLPIRADGSVGENPWAFCPLYPMIVRVVGALTDAHPAKAAPLVSLACAVSMAALLIPLLRPRLGGFGAWLSVVIVFSGPAAPIFQMAYSDAAGALVTVAVLVCLDRRRWLTAAALVPVAALTRPIAPPLFALVALLTLLSWRSTAAPERRRMLLTCTAAIGSVGLWPAIAWFVTDRPDAYTATESAWHGGGLTPFIGTVHDVSSRWGPWGPLVLVAIVVCVLALLFGPMGARLGHVMRLWCVLYVLYVGAVGGMFSSYPRLLLLCFPITIVATGAARERNEWTRGRLVWAGIVGTALLASQAWWSLLTLTGRPYMAP